MSTEQQVLWVVKTLHYISNKEAINVLYRFYEHILPKRCRMLPPDDMRIRYGQLYCALEEGDNIRGRSEIMYIGGLRIAFRVWDKQGDSNIESVGVEVLYRFLTVQQRAKKIHLLL